ncbi:MAG: tetratricopeptide repeat protein [Proteobacteria bacterium]|nr:tetratricopeptide repeat protein [Pseudomonadota bacterium]
MTDTASTIKRVLIIDDDESIGELVRDYLKGWSCDQVDAVTDGTAAWGLLQAAPYDLIVLDWRLPGVSGMALFNRLRTLPIYDKTPVLVSSGLLVQDDFRLLDEYPCTQCLAKPYGEHVFRDSVTRLLTDSAWYESHRDEITVLMRGVAQKSPESLTKLQRILSSHPSNGAPLALMAARAAKAQGDLSTAEALLAGALKRHSESVPLLFELAKIYFATKRHDEAMALLTKAQRLSPRNLSRAHLMGEVALNQTQPAAAAEFFSQALKIDPEYEPAKRGLAVSELLQQGVAEEGGAPVPVHQSFASMINLIAIALVRSGKFTEGIQRYQEAMEFVQDPHDRARLAFNLGLGCSRSGEHEAARRWFLEADRLSGGTLAKARRALGHVEAAESMSDDLEEIEPEGFTAVAPASARVPKPGAVAPTAAAPSAPLQSVPPPAAPHSPVMDAKAPHAPRGVRPQPKPPANESLLIPQGVLAPAKVVALVKQAVAAMAKKHAEQASGAKMGQLTVLMYHHQDRGWARAEKQLQLLGVKSLAGFTQIPPLLDALRESPLPLVLIWNDSADDNHALDALEAILELGFSRRIGLLVHCVGDKAIAQSMIKRPHALLYDRMAVVDWARAKFEADISSTLNSMLGPSSVLSLIVELNKKAAEQQKGEALPPVLSNGLALASKKVPFPSAQIWVEGLHVACLAKAGRLDDARRVAAAMLQRCGDAFVARFAVASLDAEAGQIKPALELIEWLHLTRQASPERIAAVAGMLVDHGQHAAVRLALQAASLAGGFAEDYRYLMLAGRVLLGEGQLDAAAHCCEAAIRLYPTRWDLLGTYAAVLLQLNDVANALAIVESALQCVGSDQRRLRVFNARCLGVARRWAEAEACLQPVLMEAPNDPEAQALKLAIDRREVGTDFT